MALLIKTSKSVLLASALVATFNSFAYAEDDDLTTSMPHAPFEKSYSLQGHWNNINDVALSPDGRYAATVSADSSMIVWNVDDGSQKFSVKYKAGEVITESHNIMAVTFSPDSKHVVSASYQREHFGDVQMHALKKGKRKWRWGTAPGISALDYSSDGKNVVIGYMNGKRAGGNLIQNMHMQRVLKGKNKQHVNLTGHTDMVASVQFSPDSRRIVSTSLDNNVVVWDAAKGNRIFGRKYDGFAEDAVFTPDGKYIAVSTGTEIEILDAKNGTVVRKIDEDLDKYELFRDLAAHPDGEILAAASTNGSIFFFDISSGNLAYLIPNAHSEPVNSVAYGPKGDTLITGSDDDTAIIWKKR